MCELGREQKQGNAGKVQYNEPVQDSDVSRHSRVGNGFVLALDDFFATTSSALSALRRPGSNREVHDIVAQSFVGCDFSSGLALGYRFLASH